VAITAFRFQVAPAQGKSGLRVLEFQFGSKRLPGLCRMAFLAWDLEFVSVGAVRRQVRAMRRYVRIDWLAHRNT